MSIEHWNALTRGEPGSCDQTLLHFSIFVFIFHILFVASLVLVLCVGCLRSDYCRAHDLFRDERRRTTRRRRGRYLGKRAHVNSWHNGGGTINRP